MKKRLQKPFRARARLLALLGEQLIDNAKLAVFELVKNSYDADASEVQITLDAPDAKTGSIVVLDDGTGMSLDIIQNVWLEPGADSREIQRRDGVRSKRFRRLPLGEKGVGRFAAHKLGRTIKLWTRAKGQPEYFVNIDWAKQTDKKYLDQTQVEIVETKGEFFRGRQTGTRIEIAGLRVMWKRGDVRRLWRNVTSISSPFATADNFDVNLDVVGRSDWLDKLLDVPDILERAIWEYTFKFSNGKFNWSYEFRPPKGMKIKGRKTSERNEKLPIVKKIVAELYDDEDPPKHFDKSFNKEIGPITGTFYVFDQDRDVVPYVAEAQQIFKFLAANGGVRVYRDDIRVYSYGEPSDDWLGLDLRRVNQPAKAVSNNNLIGLISISLAKSTGLREKTSRDGFDDNEAYRRFRAIVLSSLVHLEAQRTVDKDRMRQLLERTAKESKISPNAALRELRNEIDKYEIDKKVVRLLGKVERRVELMQETFLRPGTSQMHVATLFHEVEHGVRALYQAIRRGEPIDRLEARSNSLIELIDSFSTFFRKTPATNEKISEILRILKRLNIDRFERHKIILSMPVGTEEADDFRIKGPKNIVMGAISNIIDNSIYWLDQEWPDDGTRRKRAIRITTTDYFDGHTALVIADNGPGYHLAPEDVMQPFVTLKPDGMGIGMYYVRLVMEAFGGYVAFPSAADVGIPRSFKGAVTALVFPSGRWL